MVDSKTQGRKLPDLEESISQPPTIKDSAFEMGISTELPGATWATFPFNQDFGFAKSGVFEVGTTDDHVDLASLRKMRIRDGQTRALLRMFQLPIMTCLREGEWIRDPSRVDSENDGKEEVDFANNVFKTPLQSGGMEIPIRKVLEQLLLAIFESSSTLEIIHDAAVKGPMKGLYFPRKLAHRDLRTLTPLVDQYGDFVGVRQRAVTPGGVTLNKDIAKDCILRYVCNEAEAPVTGVSMFESSWFHYQVKTKLYYISNVAAQFASVPGRIGTVSQSATPSQRENFARALAGFSHNTSMIMPQGFSVDAFNGNIGFDFMKLIDHHNHQQSKSVLLQFMDNDTRMAVIENGGQDASADMFVQALKAIMDEISDVFTHQLMPRYIDWNFNSDNYPIWRFAPLTDSSKDTIKELFSSFAVSQTLNITPEFFRQLEKKIASTSGLDIDYSTIENNEARASEKAAAIAQAQAEALDLRAQLQAGQQDPNNPPPSQDQSSSAPGIGDTNKAAAAALSGDAYLDSIDDLYRKAQQLFLSEPEVFGM